ncbi:MAG: adenosylmethionine decarboxylase [Lachnospirales bacterium]
MNNKIRLYGFNNLTKTLSFNIYDVCYAKTLEEKKAYLDYIDEQYNSERLTKILCDVTKMIGASVLNISKQDYDPQGASVNLLISEEPVEDIDPSCNKGEGLIPLKDSIMGHLDKSHLTVHTYPESHPDNNLSTFRVDIDVSTCGTISPLKALNYLIDSFDSDILTLDYRVRGFTREVKGKKCYIDHEISSIQDYIFEDTITQYHSIDMNIYQSNLFHTKMRKKELELSDYIFNKSTDEIDEEEQKVILSHLEKEMQEIFTGTNIYSK